MFSFKKREEQVQRSEDVKEQIRALEGARDELNDDLLAQKNKVAEVKNKLAEVEAKHKRADEDIRHLVKIRESQFDIEYKKKELELEKEKQSEIAKVKDEYRDKLEEELQDQLKRMQDMYKDILDRLPDVNVRLKGGV